MSKRLKCHSIANTSKLLVFFNYYLVLLLSKCPLDTIRFRLVPGLE